MMSARQVRAERFRLPLSLRYRCGSAPWVHAFTLNVSRSGALAHAALGAELPVGVLDFELALPPCGISELALIRGVGRVVRVSNGATRAFAFSIERYRFVKPGESKPVEGEIAR